MRSDPVRPGGFLHALLFARLFLSGKYLLSIVAVIFCRPPWPRLRRPLPVPLPLIAGLSPMRVILFA